MATRTISLIAYRNNVERAHWSIWVPYEANPTRGSIIHVVGSPMIGFALEFKRNYNPKETLRRNVIMPLAQVSSQHIADFPVTETWSRDPTPRGNLELQAVQVPPPGVSPNIFAPVNKTTNRTCQEWIIDYVRRLVSVNYIDQSAIDILLKLQDPPMQGIGLRHIASQIQATTGAVNQPQQALQSQQSSQVRLSGTVGAGSTASVQAIQPLFGKWEKDLESERWRRWNYTANEWKYGNK